MRKEYNSNAEFFEDVNLFEQELLVCGHNHAAKQIHEGLGCINGLTDGWALFMESLEKVLSEYTAELSKEQKEKLTIFLGITKKAIYRK